MTPHNEYGPDHETRREVLRQTEGLTLREAAEVSGWSITSIFRWRKQYPGDGAQSQHTERTT